MSSDIFIFASNQKGACDCEFKITCIYCKYYLRKV